MKTKICMAVMAALLVASAASAQRGGYYASKADERAGRLTPGVPTAPPSSITNSGGDTCAAAVVIPDGAGNFTDSGTTIGADSTVSTLPLACNSLYTSVAGPDVIYSFSLGPVASRGTPLTITVTPTGGTGFDTSIYILSTAGIGCPSGINNTANNCLVGSDSASFNGAETITDAQTDAIPAGTYFLFVDSFYSTGSAAQPNRLAGPYSLVMGARPLPVELLDFSID